MNLNMAQKNDIANIISFAENEKLWFSAPFDVDTDGSIIKDKSVLGLFTNLRFMIIRDGTVTEEIPVSTLNDIKCEPLIGGGILTVFENKFPRVLLRFSMKHLVRYSYIAKGAAQLIKGQEPSVISTERENFCTICGRALPGTKSCPRCDKSGTAFKNFIELCKPYFWRLILVSVLIAGAAAATIYQQFVIKDFIDSHLVPKDGTLADVTVFAGSLLSLIIFSIIVNVIKSYLCVSLGTKISTDLRQKVYIKVQQLSLSFINRNRAGDLINRMISDTNEIRRFMEAGFVHIFSSLVTMAAVLAIMLSINWKLTLMSVVFIPVIMILSRVFWRKIHRMFRNQWRKNDAVSSKLQDVLSGMRVVKSYGKEQSEAEKFCRMNNEFISLSKRNEHFWAIFYPVLTFIMGLGIYVVTYFGGRNVLFGGMTIGTLAQFIAFAGILYGPLGWMTNLPRMIIRMISCLERIYDILGETPEIDEVKSAKTFEIEGKIEFKNAGFGYRSYEPVLENINLEVKPGEMIGLVGSSGAGKSTMINLIMRLYDVDSGTLTVDGTDIKELSISSLHGQIGVVLQETFLFSGTILDNIRFAKPEATLSEVIRAAKIANAHDFITKSPDGYNTYVGERGMGLSGGERQRIAIARAVIGNPRILILDEATSSLDTESEYIIQRALDRLTVGRTTMAIAHRLSTLKGADRLMVIDKNTIAECGSHDELIAQKGIYYGLVQAQLQMSGTDPAIK